MVGKNRAPRHFSTISYSFFCRIPQVYFLTGSAQIKEWVCHYEINNLVSRLRYIVSNWKQQNLVNPTDIKIDEPNEKGSANFLA